MITKNLLVTLLGFLVALTAYFNVQSGIKEDFLGLSGITRIRKTVAQRLNKHSHSGGGSPDNMS